MRNPILYPLTYCVFLRAQKFDLVLDTGSSDLWFAITGCSGCISTTPTLDTSKSSTIQLETQRIALNYGSGNAEGVLARDTVTMGPFNVNPQIFGVYFVPTCLSISIFPFSSRTPGVLFPVGTCDKCHGVLVRWQLMTVPSAQLKALIGHQLRSKTVIDLPLPLSVPAFSSAMLICAQLLSMIYPVG